MVIPKQIALSVNIETITPEIAASMLTSNLANRPMRERNVERLVRDLQDGNFYLSTDCIGFDTSGLLVNGQHRLTACVKAGVSFQAVVLRGLNNESYNIIDTGVKRQVSDTLHRACVPYYATVATLARWVADHESGVQLGSRGINPTANQVLSAASRHADILHDAAQVYHHLNKFTRGTYGALVYWKIRTVCADRSAVDEFYRILCEAASEERGTHPARVLRDRLLAGGRNAMPAPYTCAVFVKAWNAYRENRTIQVLKWLQSEDFPEVTK